MIGAQRRIATAVALSATLVAALPASAAGPAEHARGDWVFAVGPDFGAGMGRAWRASFATVEYRGPAPLTSVWGTSLYPVWSVSANRRGAALVTFGVHANLSLGAVEVTPHFGVGLYSGGQGIGGKELLQFRSGIDAFVPLSETTAIGLGIVHVSNARITDRSANLDILRLSVRQRF